MSTRMRRTLWWIVATAVLSAAIHGIVIVGYPYILMHCWHRRLVAEGARNQFVHGGTLTAKDRDRPKRGSPDLAYSAMAYDLSDGPLRVTIPLTGQYMSVSLYAANMDNYFVLNDRQIQSGQFDFVLIGPATPDAANPDSKSESLPTVRSPNAKGIALLRFLVLRPGEMDKIESVRKRIRCDVVDETYPAHSVCR
jgi:uncharacterized membrane protein